MSQQSLNLDDLFLEAFGYRSMAFDPRFNKLPSKKDLGKGGVYYDKDIMGREYFLPVLVDVGDDTIPGTGTTYAQALGVRDENGTYTGKWKLPYPVMSVELNVHFVDTELTERDGMVSELINISGYKIHIKGFLVNKQANTFPADDFDTLNRLVNLKVPISIYSVVTNILLFNNPHKQVTIRTLKLPEHPGVKNVRPYELELVSEVPFSLIDIS